MKTRMTVNVVENIVYINIYKLFVNVSEQQTQ